MGGCCCCSYKGGAELSGPVEYPYYPRASDEHIPLSTHQHVPYDADIRHPWTPPGAQGISGDKGNSAAQTANSESEITAASETLESMLRREDLLESEDKDSPDTNLVAAKNPLSKSAELFALPIEEEDVCPICLEEYDKENPKITTKCEHNFHLSCIFEWMERSDTCAVCAQEMIFSPPH